MPVVRRSDRTRNLRAPNVTRWQGGNATAPTPPPSFDPLTLTWTRYYDYSDASSVTLNGSTISQINDLSGNLGHASQGTAANQPEYSLAAQNGLNVGTFDGTNDVLSTAADVTLARPAMLFLVARFTGAAASTHADIFSIGSGVYLIRKNATTDYWAAQNGVNLPSTVVADNTWHVFCARFDNLSSYLMIDGVSVATGASGTSSASAASVFMGAATGGVRYLNGQIGFAALGAPQTDTDRDALVTHLMTTWL